MPRSPRTDFAGAWHHVMNRAATGRKLFTTDADSELFVAGFAEAGDRYGVEVHAYCLMTNHFHLLLLSREGKLSDFMRFLVGRFTRLHNLRHATDGAVFRGRFVSKLIDSDAQLIEAGRYIHLNPVRAGLVSQAEDWNWSSAQAYLDAGCPPDWLLTGEMLAMFGRIDAKRRYRDFLTDGLKSG